MYPRGQQKHHKYTLKAHLKAEQVNPNTWEAATAAVNRSGWQQTWWSAVKTIKNSRTEEVKEKHEQRKQVMTKTYCYICTSLIGLHLHKTTHWNKLTLIHRLWRETPTTKYWFLTTWVRIWSAFDNMHMKISKLINTDKKRKCMCFLKWK